MSEQNNILRNSPDIEYNYRGLSFDIGFIIKQIEDMDKEDSTFLGLATVRLSKRITELNILLKGQ